MKFNIKYRLNKLYKSSWFITLFATTLGVLLAFYLNNLNDNLKIESSKQVVIKNLNNEITNNKLTLNDPSDNQRLINFLLEVREIDEEISNELTTSIHNINELKINYPDFIEIKDSIDIDVNLFKYNVSYKLELNFNDLQKISWETSKMSDVINELNYDCLEALNEIYYRQGIYTNQQQKTLEYFVSAEHKKLLKALNIIEQLKSQLIDQISESQNKIKNCD
ncbi:hypothetical protein [Maribacter sp. HTCC2170]|uniref:hypothetical protein n=1 Tax=Maribacter sp. (strain HTCC2170 / KCCM 42371) TaxID=313603 RepID=UPI00006BB852|nr:hypothetical protein [Maribacter sp. HTCC2170]EAQ99691.1 hypothetical protein FB2170_10274 [Maribacter sp. HTCC2170]